MTVQNRIKAIKLANRLEKDEKMKKIIAVKIVDKENKKEDWLLSKSLNNGGYYE